MRTHCWFCGSAMNWSSDFDFEDYGIESKNGGVVAILHCTNEECGATAEFYTKIDDLNEEEEQ
jgi:hypothetical protein